MHTNHRRGAVKRRDHRWRENSERDVWRKHVPPPPFEDEPMRGRMKIGKNRTWRIKCRWYSGDPFGWFMYSKNYANRRDRDEAIKTLRSKAPRLGSFSKIEYMEVDP